MAIFGHFWPFLANLASQHGQTCNFGSEHTSNLLLVSPGFWALEIHWDHFQIPQIDLSAQMAFCGHFGQLKCGKMAKFVSFILSMLET